MKYLLMIGLGVALIAAISILTKPNYEQVTSNLAASSASSGISQTSMPIKTNQPKIVPHAPGGKEVATHTPPLSQEEYMKRYREQQFGSVYKSKEAYFKNMESQLQKLKPTIRHKKKKSS